MELTTTAGGAPPTNPPSVEAAYKRKCIQLKKRLNEIEAENENIRARNKRSMAYVQKMRLESCILLERLARLTGMMDEVANTTGGLDGNTELRARIAAITPSTNQGQGQGVLDDQTEGSSEEQPPTVSPPDSLEFYLSLFLLCRLLVPAGVNSYKRLSCFQI